MYPRLLASHKAPVHEKKRKNPCPILGCPCCFGDRSTAVRHYRELHFKERRKLLTISTGMSVLDVRRQRQIRLATVARHLRVRQISDWFEGLLLGQCPFHLEVNGAIVLDHMSDNAVHCAAFVPSPLAAPRASLDWPGLALVYCPYWRSDQFQAVVRELQLLSVVLSPVEITRNIPSSFGATLW